MPDADDRNVTVLRGSRCASLPCVHSTMSKGSKNACVGWLCTVPPLLSSPAQATAVIFIGLVMTNGTVYSSPTWHWYQSPQRGASPLDVQHRYGQAQACTMSTRVPATT